jgi:acyl carrier protein
MVTALEARRLEDWLIARIGLLTGIDPDHIDPTQPMEAYGLTSLMAVELSVELEDMLEIALDATIAWDYPSISTLATYLAAKSVSAAGDRT